MGGRRQREKGLCIEVTWKETNRTKSKVKDKGMAVWGSVSLDVSGIGAAKAKKETIFIRESPATPHSGDTSVSAEVLLSPVRPLWRGQGVP